MMNRISDFFWLIWKLPLQWTIFLHKFYDRLWPFYRFVAFFYRRIALRRVSFVTVIGSLGKTTTTRAVEKILDQKSKRKPFSNYGTGLAASLLKIRPWDRFAVLEVGVNRPGWMETFAYMLRPDMAVVTSINSEHNRSFKTLEETRQEKVEMVRALRPTGLAILNGDDPHVRWMATQTKAKAITFGFGENNDVWASDVKVQWPDGIQFSLHTNGQQHTVQSRLWGRHMIYPLMAAFCVGQAVGMKSEDIIQKLETISPISSRMEKISLPQGATLFDDSFKGALESIEAALETLKEIPAARKVLVLVNIEEPPGRVGDVYRALGEKIARVANVVIYIGDDNFQKLKTGAVRAGMSADALIYAGSRVSQVLDIVKSHIRPQDVVLVKGSGSQKLRRVVLELQQKHVVCTVKYCQLKVSLCDECPLLNRSDVDFNNHFVKIYIRP